MTSHGKLPNSYEIRRHELADVRAMQHNKLPSSQNGRLRGRFDPGYNPKELVIGEANEGLIDHAKPVHVAATTLRAIRATPTRRPTQMAVDCLSPWNMCEGGSNTMLEVD